MHDLVSTIFSLYRCTLLVIYCLSLALKSYIAKYEYDFKIYVDLSLKSLWLLNIARNFDYDARPCPVTRVFGQHGERCLHIEFSCGSTSVQPPSSVNLCRHLFLDLRMGIRRNTLSSIVQLWLPSHHVFYSPFAACMKATTLFASFPRPSMVSTPPLTSTAQG